MFFPLIDIVSNIDYPIFWYFERSCWDHYPTFYTTVLLKVVEWKFWVWLFYKNIKDAINEGLPYITHFAVLHPFLRGPQISSRFIRHLTLIHSKFIKQKNSLLFRIKFKQFHTFNAYSKLQCVFKLYAHFSLQ